MILKILSLPHTIYIHPKKKNNTRTGGRYNNCLGKSYPMIFQRKYNQNSPQEPLVMIYSTVVIILLFTVDGINFLQQRERKHCFCKISVIIC